MTEREEVRIAVPGAGEVSALLWRPTRARALLVLGHGAGAGMRHAFLQAICSELEEQGIATLRYNFPYAERGARRPDRPPILVESVRAAVGAADQRSEGLPLFAGGKSMGGRMTSTAAAEGKLGPARGVVFLGFPLHPAGRPSTGRAAHLERVTLPLLFLQGTRDALAELDLLRPVCEALGSRATLHVVEGADHGFRVLKRSGRAEEEVRRELATVVVDWMEGILQP